jgi:hypothetical protein
VCGPSGPLIVEYLGREIEAEPLPEEFSPSNLRRSPCCACATRRTTSRLCAPGEAVEVLGRGSVRRSVPAA